MFIGSVEGKSVVSPHPGVDVNSTNASYLSKGHVQNVRRGQPLQTGEETLIGDLVLTDSFLISQVQNGLREISLGYECQYLPQADGTYRQTSLVCNHVAIVPSGRNGPSVRVLDTRSKEDEVDNTKELIAALNRVTAKLQPIERQPAYDRSDYEAQQLFNRVNGSAEACEFASKCNELGAKMRQRTSMR